MEAGKGSVWIGVIRHVAQSPGSGAELACQRFHSISLSVAAAADLLSDRCWIPTTCRPTASTTVRGYWRRHCFGRTDRARLARAEYASPGRTEPPREKAMASIFDESVFSPVHTF